MRFEAPEDLLPPARVLWDVVGTLDLRPFLAEAKSVEGSAGRDLLSPRMLLAENADRPGSVAARRAPAAAPRISRARRLSAQPTERLLLL